MMRRRSMQACFVCLTTLLIILTMSACAPAAPSLPLLEATPTPTATPTATATIVWFPPTATPTRFPTPVVTPTVDYHPGIGEIIFGDNFSEPGSWVLGKTSSGSAALGKNELSLVISEPGAYEYTVRAEPILTDFYAEITANPTLCRGLDEYGLLVRYNSPVDFYRFSLSCDGQVRLDRLVSGKASSPQPWTQSGSVPPGAPSFSRLAVWASGNEIRFFINDQYQFSVNDPLLLKGSLGLFARSAGEMAVTVNFSDLVVKELSD
jgi:hypothetical protein